MEENRHPYRKKSDWDQEDVLENKDHVTTGSRGIQQWDTEPKGVKGQKGDASEGTAARSARLQSGQLGEKADSEAEATDEDA